MQVRAIVLYNYKGEKRILPFKLGQVNIITGESETGKSSIINILDYCTGRSSFKMFKAEGVNIGVVAWYAVHLQIGNMQVFIAKPPPKGNSKTQSEGYIKDGESVQLPEIQDIKLNTNDDGIDARLSNLLGIAPNKALSPSRAGQDPGQASLKHTKYFLFQGQNLVSNPEMLFWRQNDAKAGRHLSDSLYYFLGADQDERWEKEKKLQSYQQLLQKYETRHRVIELRRATQNQSMRTMLLQAQQVGLVANQVPDDEMLSLLRILIGEVPTTDSNTVIIANSPLEEERRRAQELNRDFRDKLREIDEMKEFRREAETFSSATQQHADRLRAVEVFTKDENTHEELCPLCSQTMDTPPPTVAMLTASLVRMQNGQNGVRRERPQLEQQITELENQLEDLREARRLAEERVKALQQEQDASGRLRDLELRAARMIGRIEEYLKSLELVTDETGLADSITNGKKKIEALKADMGSEDVKQAIDASLTLLTGAMTRWATELKMRYQGLPHQLDLYNMTVAAVRGPGNSITMENMGGGSNALGCHLIALVALHRFFIRYNKPVPGFIVLDQPSQVYFPSLQEYRNMLEGSNQEMTNLGGDVGAVQRMFKYLFDRVKELSPNLQIIVTEHANLDTPEYQQALVENPWVGGRGLIPHEWIKEVPPAEIE